MMTPAARARTFSATAIVLLVFAGTGCAGPAPEASPAGTASSAPNPTPTAAAGDAAIVFGGDCESILPTKAITAALGEDFPLVERDLNKEARMQIGGLQCTWTSDVYTGFPSLEVFFAPANDTVRHASEVECNDMGEDASYCVFDLGESSGYRASGIALLPPDVSAKLPSAVREFTRLFAESAAASVAPMPEVQLTLWDGSSSCEQLDARARISQLAPGAALHVDPDPADRPLSYVSAEREVGNKRCMWISEGSGAHGSEGFYLDIRPGGAASYSASDLEGAEQVELEGADEAWMLAIPDNKWFLNVLDGPNLLMFRSDATTDPRDYFPIAESLVATLNEPK